MGREEWVEIPFIPPRAETESVNSYVFSTVASQVGFSTILELRFQKVKIRISLSNCWT